MQGNAMQCNERNAPSHVLVAQRTPINCHFCARRTSPGQYDLMIPDAECLKLCTTLLTRLGLPDHQIKLNHRILLEAMFEIAGGAFSKRIHDPFLLYSNSYCKFSLSLSFLFFFSSA
jgi:hypothetical protein